MARIQKRIRKSGPASDSPNSAALVPDGAGLPAQGGGPVGRPAWAPGDVDLFKVPEPVRQAAAEIIEPAYRQLVATVEDPLERSIGLTLVHLMWLEVLDQHEAKHEYLATSLLELPEDRSGMIDRHLRMLNTKVKVGSFLIRLRELRRQSETAAQSQPAFDVSRPVPDRPHAEIGSECGKDENCHPKTEAGSWEMGVGGEKVSVTRSRGGWDGENDTRPEGEADGKCGKPESCHPKKQMSGVRRQVSETGTRPEGEADGKCGKPKNCHPKTEAGSWGKGSVRSTGFSRKGGRPPEGGTKA